MEASQVEIDRGELRFASYPFEPSSVHPTGVVAAEEIRDIDPTSAPPEVRLRTGETLFISAQQRENLETFCLANGIPMKRRPDLWGAILEPFVDTEFTDERADICAARLSHYGIASEETLAIRTRFRDVMVAYNFESGLWDCTQLGLADLLDAIHGFLSGPIHRLPPDELAATYEWAMLLADRSGDDCDPLGKRPGTASTPQA
jgi:hypothetical protein